MNTLKTITLTTVLILAGCTPKLELSRPHSEKAASGTESTESTDTGDLPSGDGDGDGDGDAITLISEQPAIVEIEVNSPK